MVAVTIRGLSEETHRALNVRAVQHGRSMVAEIRIILEEAVRNHESSQGRRWQLLESNSAAGTQYLP
jgi:plasmid stability protein